MSKSARNLILANLATLIAALILSWDIGWLFWPYWIQSVVIGWYARKRMLGLVRFSTRGFTSGGQPVPTNEEGKRSTALFFACHYGFFHLMYFIFLVGDNRLTRPLDLLILLACGFSFVLSQRATYAAQHAADLRGCPNLGKIMATPYVRILPMHLGVMFCSGAGDNPIALTIFTVLKTASDLGLDLLDRRMAEQGAGPVVVQTD